MWVSVCTCVWMEMYVCVPVRVTTTTGQLQNQLLQKYGSEPSNIRRLFLKCDRDSNGNSSIPAIAREFRTLGLKVTDADVQQLFSEVGTRDSVCCCSPCLECSPTARLARVISTLRLYL